MNGTDAAPVPRICEEVDMAKNPSTAIHWREDITPGRTPVATLSHRQIVETTNKGGCPLRLHGRSTQHAATKSAGGSSRVRRSARFQLLGRTAELLSSLLVPRDRRAEAAGALRPRASVMKTSATTSRAH